MPDTQELIALGIVALVAGVLIWRRFAKRDAGQTAGACRNCDSAGPPPKEAPVRFYRRHRTDEDPEGGSPG